MRLRRESSVSSQGSITGLDPQTSSTNAILAKNLYRLENLFAVMHHYIKPNNISSALYWMSTLCIIHKIYDISIFFPLVLRSSYRRFFQVQKYDGAHSFH